MEMDKRFDEAERWVEEGKKLRAILLDCGLSEDLKWGKPCYGHLGNNVAIIQRMQGSLALMFFKGVLLADPEGVLHPPGPNSRVGRRFEFTSMAHLDTLEPTLRSTVAEAMALEAEGRTVELDDSLELVDELADALEADADLRKAFEGLTPGRQRAYNLHVGGAVQSATRTARVEKARPQILAGKGLRDR